MKAVVAAALAALALAPLVSADGDPASDFLISQTAFLPFDAKIDDARKADLNDLLEAARKKGFPIKVAVIATKTDLGAVPVLYGQPQRYARFLGQELFYWYKDELLVVMPNGYGLNRAPAADKAALAKLRPPGTRDGNALVASAERAVRTLARRHGVTLPAASAHSGSSSNRDRLELALGAVAIALAVALAVLTRRRSRRRAADG